jgi:REP element-mobilizing transposase RayT
MEPAEREVVRDAIVALCREKGWRLMALHVRTNHVHVVIGVDYTLNRQGVPMSFHDGRT